MIGVGVRSREKGERGRGGPGAQFQAGPPSPCVLPGVANSD